jgi:CHAT domain
MALERGERLVLTTLRNLQGVSGDYVDDARLASSMRMLVEDVRDWLETLEGKGFVERARRADGVSAYVTAKGKLELRLAEPIANPKSGTAVAGSGESILTVPLANPQQSRVTTPPLPATVRTILILAANPKGTEHLRFDEEFKKIEQGLERARNRDQFKLVPKWAVKIQDLYGSLLVNEPEIVHFSGHSSGADGLTFEDDSGQIHLVPEDALARLFELCSDHVKCVVLNACYFEAQADAIAKHIDYVVGMKKAIDDEAAIKFAVGFYDALGAGRDIEKAFKFGCSAIDLKGIPEYLTPVLKKKP